VVKRELSWKAKLSIYRSIYVLTLTVYILYIYLILPGNASGSPKRSWRVLLGRRKPGGGACLASTPPPDPTPDKQKKMDG